jgi:signal transduction histidine kinase
MFVTQFYQTGSGEMAPEVSTAGARQDLHRRVAELERELSEAQQREAATAELLQVINCPQFALQSVFEAIAQSAMRLCEGEFAFVLRFDGELLRFAASYGLAPEGLSALQNSLPRPAGDDTANGRAVLRRAVVQIPNVQADPDYGALGVAQKVTYQSLVAVPLLRDGSPIGGITVGRARVGPFSEGQIRLLRTFANQAVIAIESTRLFEEVQQKNRALAGANVQLAEALEQQTATADILRVISNSLTDVQPVLDAVAANSAHLCMADDAQIYVLKDNLLVLGASYGPIPHFSTRQLSRGWVTGRSVIDCRTIHVHDLAAESEAEYPVGREAQRLIGHRTTLATPLLLRKGVAVGAILIRRMEVHPFSERQIKLLETFADQAAIAIENTRLFEAEQASKRELEESLQYQTATAEVLSVISRSPNQLQPVLDTITETAARLCQADYAHFRLLHEGAYHVASSTNYDPLTLKRLTPIAVGPGSIAGRVALECKTVHLPDIMADATGDYTRQHGEVARTGLGVPLMKVGTAVGVIMLFRKTVRPFTDRQIALVNTFAEQALIAMENTRLFEEVQTRTRELTESLQQQTGTADVLKVISRSAFDLRSVLQTLVESAARLCDADKGTITRQIDGVFYRAESYGFPAEVMQRWRNVPVTPERGSAAGRALLESRAVHVPDADADPHYTFDTAGARTMLGVPMLREGTPIGVLALARSDVRPFTDKQIDLVSTFADQAAIAIENVRLFEEVQARTSELAKTVEHLEVASQHKSQFVANMSHELRTPLAAILGYAELMQEGFYEPLGQKSVDALTRIRSNGKHLLGLINTVLDIAKIESGQFTLNMAEYAIESVVETVRSATESLAQNKKLVLSTDVAKSLPFGLGDEQRLTQVLLNLVGNAIKFTDKGEVRVSAKAVNGHFALSVTDTGPGIPQEHQGRIFEHFHQVDSSITKSKGGTGLGLAIAKEIVEMHGGRIWVESTLGKGSIFQMELPIRAEFRKSVR